MPEPDVVLDEERSRFELEDEGHTAFITFTRDGDVVTLVHTEVPEELAGRGVGTALVRGALAYLREHGLGLVPQCPFVRSYLQREPDEAASFGIDPSTL
jgi:predicted GNAT family acetyltransferase